VVSSEKYRIGRNQRTLSTTPLGGIPRSVNLKNFFCVVVELEEEPAWSGL